MSTWYREVMSARNGKPLMLVSAYPLYGEIMSGRSMKFSVINNGEHMSGENNCSCDVILSPIFA
jgi:hypothetical protein